MEPAPPSEVRYDAVLFDFGGVFTVSPFETVREAGSALGLDADSAIALCFGPYDRDGDHPWHRLERGEVSLADARAALAELASRQGLELDPLSLLMGQVREDEQRPELVDRAIRVRKSGLRTACVTNNVVEFGDAWKAMVPVDDLFEVVIDSSVVGVRKPDPRIFLMALDALGTSADRAVFLDDHVGNIASAESLGIRSILVGPDRRAAFDELEELLGL